MTSDTSNTHGIDQKHISTLSFLLKKEQGIKITMLTAYDYPTAMALNDVGIDGILVGDSLAMVVLGYENTLPVTMDEMLYHCRAVARGATSPLLVGDMPFMSYQVSVSEAVANAGRFLKEGAVNAVKLEGGRERIEAVRAVVGAGIPVMGHLGLTPQSVHMLGGFRSQGKNAEKARILLNDALLLEEAGCFSLVLESIPTRLAAWISSKLSIPTIGIGAGAGCDGQILVTHDLLGLYKGYTPRFVRKYADLFTEMVNAFRAYMLDVKAGKFPSREQEIDMTDEEWEVFMNSERKSGR